MHLKKLQLHGFKTFAERTIVEFSHGVTAIVGPNGSGKSNLGDAILWVLGEQKASAMRGTKAQDVIFAGSDKRKPTGMAEVSLTVDNSDGTLPVEFDEVVITRRAYRTGEGEYFLNKVPCRLKDIYELFLDTGVGRESYALVNQSQIDAVLSVNPEDRRGLFEEAAGIKKYRVKKREALRKLEATEGNLNRVRDILHEMDGRLEPLRAQAERAEHYVKLRGRLRSIESNLLIVDLRFADFELAAARKAREEEQIAVAEHAARIEAAERHAADIAQHLTDAEAKLEACRREHQAALSQAERADSQRLLADQRTEGLAQSQRLLGLESEELDARRTRLTGQVGELETELVAARQQEAILRAQVVERQGTLQRLTQEIQDLGRRGEKRRVEALGLARQQATRQAEAARAEARAAELEAGLPALRQEAERLETSARETSAALDTGQAAVDASRIAMADAERALTNTQGEREAARKAVSTAQTRLNEAQSLLIGLRTRLRTLQELEAAQEGYFAGVKAVFEARKHGALLGEFTVVADSFTSPPGYEVAFETALAASLQDIITDTEQEAKSAIAFLHDNRAGRATFLPLDRMRPGRDTLDIGRAHGMTGVLGAALEIASFDAKFRPALEVLLGRVFFCETLDDALRASQVAKGWNRVVTRTGELVLPSGALTGGRQSGRTANILGRKTEIAGLQGELQTREREAQNCQNELASAEAAREQSELTLGEAQSARQAAQLAASEAGRRAEFATNEARRLDRARAEMAQRITSSENTLGQARSQAANAQAALATGGAETADADEALAAEGERLGILNSERDVLNSDLTGARIGLATTAEKAASLDRSLRTARAELDGIGGQQTRKGQQARDVQVEFDTLVAQATLREEEVRRAVQTRDATLAALEAQSAMRQTLLQEAADAGRALRALGDTRAAALETIHKTELREARLGAQRDSLAGRLWEDYEISLATALALPEDPEIGDGTPQEVGRLRREIRVMGDVNVGALDEWEQTRTRHEFLTTQRADLEEARVKLTDGIKEIDASTRGVFLETFHAVSAAFAEIFARLFGGGKTDLLLTDPNDILETGVDIMVQPPGKKRQNLALLSGGERALTAAALLFAFLKVKPSPFCVLDEVDAPLDGANVERFADLLREFGERSQFIIITHNPTTMEAAPIWYGVTMREPGISHVLSMQVPQTAEEEKTPRNGRAAVVQSR